MTKSPLSLTGQCSCDVTRGSHTLSWLHKVLYFKLLVQTSHHIILHWLRELHILSAGTLCEETGNHVTSLQRWELPVSPLQAVRVKDHPRSAGSGTQFPWGKAAAQLGTPTSGNSAPCGRLPQTRCPASDEAHLWRNRTRTHFTKACQYSCISSEKVFWVKVFLFVIQFYFYWYMPLLGNTGICNVLYRTKIHRIHNLYVEFVCRGVCVSVCVYVTRLLSWCACCVEHPLTLSSTKRDDGAWNATLSHRDTHIYYKEMLNSMSPHLMTDSARRQYRFLWLGSQNWWFGCF